MKPTQAALNLLAKEFTYNGMVAWSAVDTCEGTLPLWGQLVLAGYVLPRPKSLLGHDFSYEITDEGRKYLGDNYNPYDYPFFCRVCRNSFQLKQHLVEHTQRKHPAFMPLVA